jgi:ABC-type sugar transport system ATPase subunit
LLHEAAERQEPTEAVRALDGVSLTWPTARRWRWWGPLAAARDTLLRVVAGLEPPTEGAVYFDGRPMAGIEPGSRSGMVFQSYALYPHMKGEDNLAFFFRVRRRPSEEMMARIRATAEIMGLGFDDLLARKPRALSAGEQQRVAIGRCIVRDPQLFLFDEPLSNLDAPLRASTRVEIKRLLRRFGITALYVTHDQAEAVALGDRLAVMRAGRLAQVGTYSEITADPADLFVAGFLGLPPMNLLPGGRAAGEWLEGAAGRLPLPPALARAAAAAKWCWASTRGPRPGATGDANGQHKPRLAMEVVGSEADFPRQRRTVYLRAGDGLVTAYAPLDRAPAAGAQVTLALSPGALYLFDARSEARLRPGD